MGDIDIDDLDAGLAIQIAANNDLNGDGGINYLDVYKTLNDTSDDVILLDEDGVASPQIGLGFSVAQAPDIRAGGGQDEVRYNINAPVSVDGGTGFDKLVILGTEFADDIAITDGGRYAIIRDNERGCFDVQEYVKPRIVAVAPWLLGRVQNVCCDVLQEPYPDVTGSGRVYELDGGRTSTPVPTLYGDCLDC